jgi:hypothetical protein
MEEANANLRLKQCPLPSPSCGSTVSRNRAIPPSRHQALRLMAIAKRFRSNMWRAAINRLIALLSVFTKYFNTVSKIHHHESNDE